MTVVGLEAAHMMDAYAHGYDAWGDGASLSDYLKRCSSSDKYALGEWYGLLIQSTSQNSTMKRTQSSTLVSSLILYRDGFSLPEGSVGIGSVATAPNHRRQGYARRLVHGVIQRVCCGDVDSVWLWSDINPAFYATLGFRQVALKEQSALMYFGPQTNNPSTDLPDYF